MAAMARDACITKDMAHVNVAAIVATCSSAAHEQQQQQDTTPLTMLLYATDATDCHNLKLFLQRCRVADVSTAYRLQPFDAHCCHMGTAIKHLVPDRVKPSFVIFDIRTLCPDVKNYK